MKIKFSAYSHGKDSPYRDFIATDENNKWISTAVKDVDGVIMTMENHQWSHEDFRKLIENMQQLMEG